MLFVGANCNVEFQTEGGERRFLAAFSDIDDICYESELMSRGRVVMDVRTTAMVGGPFSVSCDDHMMSYRHLFNITKDTLDLAKL